MWTKCLDGVAISCSDNWTKVLDEWVTIHITSMPLIIPAAEESDSHCGMLQMISVWYTALSYCPLHNVSIKPALWSAPCSDDQLACVQSCWYSSVSLETSYTVAPVFLIPYHPNTGGCFWVYWQHWSNQFKYLNKRDVKMSCTHLIPK